MFEQFAVFADLFKSPVPELEGFEDSGKTLPFPGERFAFRRLRIDFRRGELLFQFFETLLHGVDVNGDVLRLHDLNTKNPSTPERTFRFQTGFLQRVDYAFLP